MNKQQVFDNALSGIRGQHYKPSRIDRGGGGVSSCVYFGEDGLRCGIGHNLPVTLKDEFLVNSDINRTGVSNLVARRPEVAQLFEKIPESFLRSLQTLHDEYLQQDGGVRAATGELPPNELFETRTREFAQAEGLYYKERAP